MGKSLFFLIGIFLILSIFKQKLIQKLPWYFVGLLFFPPAVIISKSPLLSLSKVIIFVIFISMIINSKNLLFNLKSFPFKFVSIFLLLCFILIGIFDPHIVFGQKLYRPISYFILNFAPLFITYSCVNSFRDFNYIIKRLFIFVFIFCCFGIVNYLMHYNIYSAFISNIFQSRDYANDNFTNSLLRFRVSSFSWNALYYGFVIVMVTYYILFYLINFKISEKKYNFYLLFLFLLLLNLFFCNSRTPLYMLTLGLFIYFIFGIEIKQKMRVILITTFFIFIFISSFNSVQKYFFNSFNTIESKETDINGSSLEMRTIQMGASYIIFQQSPFFGHGFNFISEGLGYSGDINKRKTGTNLMGFESYIYTLLIEQGICGIIGNLIFFSSIFIWLLRMYRVTSLIGKKFTILTISILLSYLLFIIGTGDLGSLPLFMSILGLNIKVLDIIKFKIKYKILLNDGNE